MEHQEALNSKRDIFVQLGQYLSATSNAEKAAEIITEAADKLLGWDACYVILYDPQAGGKPRPLLAVDVVEGKVAVELKAYSVVRVTVGAGR